MNSTIGPYADTPTLPQIKSADACRAIGCNPQWLKNTCSRTPPVVLLHPHERVDVGERQYLSLSIRSVVHLALVRRLSKLFELRRAHQYASTFTYVGSSGELPGEPSFREPGELFGDGYTFLFADPDRVHGEVVAGGPGTELIAFLGAGTRGQGIGEPVAIVNVNHVVWDVRAALGLRR